MTFKQLCTPQRSLPEECENVTDYVGRIA